MQNSIEQELLVIEDLHAASVTLGLSAEELLAEPHSYVDRFGVAPTGKRVEMSGIRINRFDEGGTMVTALSRARLAG